MDVGVGGGSGSARGRNTGGRRAGRCNVVIGVGLGAEVDEGVMVGARRGCCRWCGRGFRLRVWQRGVVVGVGMVIVVGVRMGIAMGVTVDAGVAERSKWVEV